MDPKRWSQIETLFTELITHPAEDRARLLDARTAGDTELRREVESLLACDLPDRSLDKIVRAATTAQFQVEPAEGERLGAYRLIRKIGQGGMGSVYLAARADDHYRKQVAIKLVSLGMETAESLERFRRERQILASLEHPYIARLLDGGSARLEGFPHETPYLVMEYVEGIPLTTYCDRHQLDLHARLQVFLKVCEAVSYAHQKLIVHRDLKPGNILVTADGTPRLLDFGIAKLLREEGLDGETTLAGLGLTPDYASPEQIREEPITTAADVYSLGAILYLLLTGVKPHRFTTNTPQEVRQVICETDPPKMSEATTPWRAQLRGDLEAIVSMAIRKEPERRYASVEQFTADILRQLRGWPVTARQGNFRYRTGKYFRRNRVAITAAVLVAGALMVGATAATVEAVRASRAQATAEHDRELAFASQSRAEDSRRNADAQAAEALRQRAFAETERHIAEMQKAAAETQRLRAERRFEQVHELSGKFLLDFHNAIEKLPGATPARKMVVETGLRYYDTLIKDAGNNRDLLEEIANGYDRLGDVQGNPAYANLGDTAGAVSSYRKALAIRERIDDPAPPFWHDRIQGSVKLAQVEIVRGEFEDCEHNILSALTMARRSPAATSVPVRIALARAYGAYGDLRINQGRQGEAIEPLSRLLDLDVQIAREESDRDESDGAISLAQTKLGDVLSTLGREEEALPHLRLALAIDKRLSGAQPNNGPLARRLFITYYMLGRVLRSRLGQPLGAQGEVEGYMEQASILADRMVAGDPDNRQALFDVAAIGSSWGDYLRVKGDTAAALAPLGKAVDAGERLHRLSGPGSGNQDLLRQVHQRFAAGLSAARRFEEASEHLKKAEEYVADAEKKNPGLARNSAGMAEILDSRASMYVAQKRWAEAVPVYQQLIATFEPLFQRDPNNAGYLSERPRHYAGLADCYASLSKWDLAISAIQLALERFREIELRRPLEKAEQAEREAAVAKMAQWRRI